MAKSYYPHGARRMMPSAALAVILVAALASCSTTAPEKQQTAEGGRKLTPVSFAALDGWSGDDQLAALKAFRKSCPALTSGAAQRAVVWRAVCSEANKTADQTGIARAFFETWFTPYAVTDGAKADGLFTGYYVPELRGARHRGGVYQTPLYARPDDLARIDLGQFKAELKGQHIVGKVQGRTFVPYDDRAAVARGVLEHRARPLVWVDDPVSAFFLEIQGSGVVKLAEGGKITVGYDGANGRAYVPVGRVLADNGDIPRPVTMQKIRAWLEQHPARAQQAMNANPSYVFFREQPDHDILGAQGISLTPGRSLAVDPSAVPLGTPVWLQTTDAGGASLQRLMVAQDTGGAIKGVVRGDVFWGSGTVAEAQAGAMQNAGRYYVLLPTGAKND